jgi:hypothetical protein
VSVDDGCSESHGSQATHACVHLLGPEAIIFSLAEEVCEEELFIQG